jgi:PAS domain S-box-containing protein
MPVSFLLNVHQAHEIFASNVALRHGFTLGRSPRCDLVLRHESVSRLHASVELERAERGFRLLLRDEGSTNGTFVNGECVRRRAVAINPGDSVYLGAFRLEIVDDEHLQPTATFDCTKNAEFMIEESALGPEGLPNQRLRVLHRLASHPGAPDEEGLLRETAHALAECLGIETLYMVIEGESGPPFVYSRRGTAECAPAQAAINRGLVNRCVKEGKPVIAKWQCDAVAEGRPGGGLLSAICAPLAMDGHKLGVIYAAGPAGVDYGREDLQILTLFASHMANRVAARRALLSMRREKDKLEAVLESLGEAVIITDDEYRVVTANTAAARVFEQEELVGTNLHELLVSLDPSFDPELLQVRHRFRVKRPTTRGSDSAKDAGTGRDFEVTVGRNQDGRGNGWSRVFCFRDTTRLEQLERTKSVFLKRIVHKIATPLTIVTATNSLVAEHLPCIEDQQLVELLRGSLGYSEQCAELVRKLMDFATLDFGLERVALQRSPVRLEVLLEFARESAARAIAEREFRLVVPPDAASVLIHGDEQQLELAFRHVVENAVKFGRKGGTLRVEVSRGERVTRIGFVDDGPGLSPGEAENLARILHQVDPEETGEVPGFGLGLWLVRQVIQAHGGELEVTSPVRPGEGGMCVGMTFPVPEPADLSEDDARIALESTSIWPASPRISE